MSGKDSLLRFDLRPANRKQPFVLADVYISLTCSLTGVKKYSCGNQIVVCQVRCTKADWIKQACRFMYEETPARDTTFIGVGAGGPLKPPQPPSLVRCSPLCLVAVPGLTHNIDVDAEVDLWTKTRLESISKWTRAVFRSRLLLRSQQTETEVKSLERQEQLKSDYVWFNGDNEAAEEGVIGERENEPEGKIISSPSFTWLQARNMTDTKGTSNRTAWLFKNTAARR